VSKSIPELVDEFAKHCLAQRVALNRGDIAVANRHHDKSIAAWDDLIGRHGDAGRDGLATLFRHPSVEARVSAAVFLLRHKTEEAIRVLEEAKAAGHFGAEQALERWREGTWNLDPAPPPKPEE
jgi:hypothetical protein